MNNASAMAVEMRREFAVPPPDLRWVLLIPALGLAAGSIGIAFAAREEPRVWLVAIPVVLAIWLMAWSIRRRRVVLDGDRLRIAAGINSVDIAVAELDLDAASIVRLDNAPGLRPRLKTFGTSMPGYRSGHFRLRDRSRAFVLLTDPTKVLALPQRNGRRLLLSLEKPQALLDALKTIAGDKPHR
jgi:hypothetical protein